MCAWCEILRKTRLGNGEQRERLRAGGHRDGPSATVVEALAVGAIDGEVDFDGLSGAADDDHRASAIARADAQRLAIEADVGDGSVSNHHGAGTFGERDAAGRTGPADQGEPQCGDNGKEQMHGRAPPSRSEEGPANRADDARITMAEVDALMATSPLLCF